MFTTILPPLLPLPPITSTLLLRLRNTHNLKITLKVTKKNPTSAIGASNTINPISTDIPHHTTSMNLAVLFRKWTTDRQARVCRTIAHCIFEEDVILGVEEPRGPADIRSMYIRDGGHAQ
ncbi:hypothetical protein N7449_005758 [Penicillium cf. viridicatum]|uniref:Uncharacterized protein n=1 Tax=Penicillium cf. viridicatum TaxID=2972119 RepID=A0A9W9MGM3_9EURO|nr:hypothetical protein N7449_005758 [Penicillium cf. viridicatum]